MALSVERTHDKHIYLAENRYDKPKEVSRAIIKLLDEDAAIGKETVVADFGCAAGEFLYTLRKIFPDAIYHGFDILPELIEKAKVMVPQGSFNVGSVLDSNLAPPESVDVAFLQGVHSIFEEFETCFMNLLNWTRKGGRVYINGNFNDYPFDVWIKYRHADEANPSHREPGWNMFSKATVSKFLDKVVGPGKHRFTKFEMPFDLQPNAKDLVRTWTANLDGRRVLTNGLSILPNMQILTIVK